MLDEAISYLYDDNDRLLSESKDDLIGSADRFTVYEYGPGNLRTEQTAKLVYEGLDDTGTLLEKTTYDYNLQGRLAQVELDKDADNNVDTRSTYAYNAAGIRVGQNVENSTADDGTFDDVTETAYVIDANNHTGYAQVLEERDATTGDVEKTYTIGLDVIAQQATDVASGDTLYLLADGHGSTRAVATPAATLAERYLYDAYGNMLPGAGLHAVAATALTSLLYSGEQTDITGLQYLRARFYDPSIGRFNRLDPFVGSVLDPLSLHKYLYAHSNPIMYTDPSGLFTLAGIGIASIRVVVVNRSIDAGIGALSSVVAGLIFQQSDTFGSIAYNALTGAALARTSHHAEG